MKKLGKIKIELLEEMIGDIQTDEVIITDERMMHIKERHQEDFRLFEKYASIGISDPDYIVLDCKNKGTIFMIRKLGEANLNIVVRVALSTDKKGLKNSVMTFFRLREKNLIKIIAKNKLLYKK